MEVLFKKTYEYKQIAFYKDHTLLVDVMSNNDDYNLFGDEMPMIKSHNHYTEKHPHFKYSHTTNSEEDLIKNYGNQLASISIHRLTLVVEKNEDKISLKLFLFDKNRQAGRVYFKKSSRLNFITYKFATNDLYYGNVTNGFKKRKRVSSVKRNYFGGKPFETIIALFHNHYSFYKKNEKLVENGFDIVTDAIKVFVSQIPNYVTNPDLNFDEEMFENYLKLRNIKYPNNFKLFMGKVPLPSKRLLKKFGNKFVDCYMFNNKMSGDKIRKVLHESENINDYFYKQVVNFFGDKFIKHQPYESLKLIMNYKNGYGEFGDSNTFTENDKKNAFNVFIKVIESENDNSLRTFFDHVNFYNRLKIFEEVKWKSKDIRTFREEHVDWSDRISHYTKGTYHRIYNQRFIEDVEKPIMNTNLIDYYPVVLTESKEYNQESLLQNNCVKTYVNKAASFIISVREGGAESDERATIEYLIEKNSEKVRLRRIQSLGRFNRILDTKWDLILSELDNRINNLVEKEMFDLPKVVVEINNHRIESDTKFNDNSKYLSWTSNYLSGINPNFFDEVDFLP